jgi:TatD DNase family protein
MIELVDTHTHLNDEKFKGQEKEVIERAKAAGVTRLINMGDTLASSEKAVAGGHL